MFLIISSEDFTAHTADVKCLGLGHKSGRVMVTGGDDRKVNLWSVGKPQCIMVGPLIGYQFISYQSSLCFIQFRHAYFISLDSM